MVLLSFFLPLGVSGVYVLFCFAGLAWVHGHDTLPVIKGLYVSYVYIIMFTQWLGGTERSMRSVSYLPCCQRQHLIIIEIIHHELEWVGGWRSVTWRLLRGV